MNFSALTAFLDQLVDWRIPGLDCAVFVKGKPVCRYQAGYADIEAARPVIAGDLYNLYSISKLFTCTAALQLFEQGRFLMTDPVADYLPEFKDLSVQSANDAGTVALTRANAGIRIRDLFTMSAGLTYNLDTPAIQAVKEKSQQRCPTREIIRAIAQTPLIFEPGTHWNYSLCHDVLGGLIEVISGRKFSDYLAENIFRPLEMRDTGFRVPGEENKRMASLYRFSEIKDKAVRIPLENSYKLGGEYESGGAGLISSVDDCIRFVDTLCRKGLSQKGERILASRTVDLMRTNHLDETQLKDFNWIQMSGYGYGLGVRTLIDPTKAGSLSPVGEFGWGGAAGAYALIDPENELSVFYAQHLLNSQEPFIHPRIRNLVYRCLES